MIIKVDAVDAVDAVVEPGPDAVVEPGPDGVIEPGPDAVASRALDDAAGRLSMVIARLVRVMRRGSPSGLGPGSLSALATVVRLGPMRLGDLAAREGITPPTLSRIMVGLEEGGYITRTPDPTDGRATRAEATARAVAEVTGAGSSRAEVLRVRLAALSPADLEALLRAVPVLEALAADES